MSAFTDHVDQVATQLTLDDLLALHAPVTWEEDLEGRRDPKYRDLLALDTAAHASTWDRALLTAEAILDSYAEAVRRDPDKGLAEIRRCLVANYTSKEARP